MRENCERCVIIPFPFAEIESVAPHVRNLPNFAWKPIIVQVCSSIELMMMKKQTNKTKHRFVFLGRSSSIRKYYLRRHIGSLFNI